MFGFDKSKENFGFISNSEDETLTIIRKGKKAQKVNLENLENLIIRLSRHAHLKINDLNGKLKKDHHKLVNYVELLYGNEHYHVLIDLIKKHFSKYKNPVPGTIAAYAYGCNAKTKGLGSECSSLCASSIKMNNDPNFCDFPVINAFYKDDQFNFQTVDGIGSGHEAVIHVEYSSLKTFPGFNEHEKDFLRRYEYKRVYIYGYSGDGKYVNLYSGRPECGSGGGITIEDIKVRRKHNEVSSHKNGFNGFSLSTGLLIVVLIIIILLIAFFIYKYYCNKKSE